jgi:hypothetical protein
MKRFATPKETGEADEAQGVVRRHARDLDLSGTQIGMIIIL